MTKTTASILFSGLLIFLSGCGRLSPPANGVKVYPAPGDLSAIEGLNESTWFDVVVNQENCFVYHGKELDQEGFSSQGVSFCSFEFSGTAQLQLRTASPIRKWQLRPACGITKQTADEKVVVTLTKPGKFLFEADLLKGGRQYLIVSAEPLQAAMVRPEDPSVLYLAAGVHRLGQAWDPFKTGKKTVYLAPGAVVEATIKARGYQNIAIVGKGIFAQAFVPHSTEAGQEQEWDADWMGISLRDCKQVRVEGIGIISSPSCQLEFANCEDCLARNLKLYGAGEANNDGIHTYGRNIRVNDCFIASNDNRICITGLYDEDDCPRGTAWDGSNKRVGCPVENISIDHVVMWGCDRLGGELMLTGNGSDYARTITAENLYCLRSTAQGLISARQCGGGDIQDITVRNCTMDYPGLFDMMLQGNQDQRADGGRVHDIQLENIMFNCPASQIGLRLIGKDARNSIFNIRCKNIRAADTVITDISQTAIKTNPFVKGIEFIK